LATDADTLTAKSKQADTEGAQRPSPFSFQDSRMPRYIQLATLFRRRIGSGQWSMGHQLPTVDELALECGVARATVRQALDILAEEKLIERYRAKGTFVTAQPGDGVWCEVKTDWSGLLMSPDGASMEVLFSENNVQPPVFFHAIGSPAPAYRHWRRLHWRNGRPYHLGEVYIDERLASKIPASSLTAKTSLRMLKDIRGLKIGDAWQTMTIGTADMEVAKFLQIEIHAPVAYVRRSVADRKGCVVFVGEGIYRGDVVRLDIKLS
jgi:GntR family transcriptional regulator